MTVINQMRDKNFPMNLQKNTFAHYPIGRRGQKIGQQWGGHFRGGHGQAARVLQPVGDHQPQVRHEARLRRQSRSQSECPGEKGEQIEPIFTIGEWKVF
jgi:hypothetical protein